MPNLAFPNICWLSCIATPLSLGVIVIEAQLSWAPDISIKCDAKRPSSQRFFLQPKLGEHQNPHICPVNVNLGDQQETTRASIQTLKVPYKSCGLQCINRKTQQPTIFHCSARVTLKVHVLHSLLLQPQNLWYHLSKYDLICQHNMYLCVKLQKPFANVMKFQKVSAGNSKFLSP